MDLDIKNLDIENILKGYVAIDSISCTKRELDIFPYFSSCFSGYDFFDKYKEYVAKHEIKGDLFNRHVSYALLRAHDDFVINESIKDTICLIHHCDVVPVEDYKSMKDKAFLMDEIKKELEKNKDDFPQDIKEDIESGKYLFGRGCADMKGGGAIQIALLRQLAKKSKMKVNILLLALPDEENLSAGMIGAISLLKELKDKYKLRYKIMINSEPHERKNDNNPLISLGSIGKIMPFIYVRGALSHVGRIYEGLNPLNILSKVIDDFEANIKYSDKVLGECSPPPTFLYARDLKEEYNVSLPFSAAACLNWLILNRTSTTILKDINNSVENAIKTTCLNLEKGYEEFMQSKGEEYKELNWQIDINNCEDLIKLAQKDSPDFMNKLELFKSDLKDKIKSNQISLINANFKLIEYILDFIKDSKPRVIFGFVPPYYPSVANALIDDLDEDVAGLFGKLRDFAKEHFKQDYASEHFFTGISDLSYSYIKNGSELELEFLKYMPLYGWLYQLPFSQIEEVSMPCINIGPWGKGLHRYSERVLKEDLLDHTPRLLLEAIKLLSKRAS